MAEPSVRTLNCAQCGCTGHVCAVDTLALPLGWGYVPAGGRYVGVCARCLLAWRERRG